MRTEADLREAFAHLADSAPPLSVIDTTAWQEPAGLEATDAPIVLRDPHAGTDDTAPETILVEPGDSLRRRRRGTRLAAICSAAAAAAVTVVIAGAAAITNRGQHPQTDSGPRSATSTDRPAASVPGAQPKGIPLRFDFSLASVTGFRPTSQDLARGSGTIVLYATAPRFNRSVYVTVYERGAYDPAPVKANIRLQVNGHLGYYGPIENGGSHAALGWEYANNSWVVVQSGLPDIDLSGQDRRGENVMTEKKFKPIAVQVAAAVRFGVTAPITVPFRFAYLPPGLVPNTVGNSPLTASGAGSMAFADNLPVSEHALGAAVLVDLVFYRPAGAVKCQAKETPTTVVGYSGCVSDLADTRAWTVRIPGGDLSVVVDRNHLGRYPEATVNKIISSMTLAPNPSDGSNWFDATTVLP